MSSWACIQQGLKVPCGVTTNIFDAESFIFVLAQKQILSTTATFEPWDKYFITIAIVCNMKLNKMFHIDVEHFFFNFLACDNIIIHEIDCLMMFLNEYSVDFRLMVSKQVLSTHLVIPVWPDQEAVELSRVDLVANKLLTSVPKNLSYVTSLHRFTPLNSNSSSAVRTLTEFRSDLLARSMLH